MNTKPGVLAGVGDQLGQLGKQIASVPKKTLETSLEQAGVRKSGNYSEAQDARAEEETKRMIEGIYAPSTPEDPQTASLREQLGFGKKGNTASFKEQMGFGKTETNTASFSQQLGVKTENMNTVGVATQLGLDTKPKRTPQEEQELARVKQELHKNTYYDPLTQPKPVTEVEMEEAREEQETPAQRMERMKLEDDKKKQEDEAKKNEKPNAVDMESQKTEKFRGAAG